MRKFIKLSELIAETYSPGESVHVAICDAGNGCAFGEAGQMVEYDPARHGDLVMTPTLPHMSDDYVECVWASEWIEDDDRNAPYRASNPYRWQVRF
jgi:hypothetical protein